MAYCFFGYNTYAVKCNTDYSLLMILMCHFVINMKEKDFF